jgi:hypothetical protein
MLILLKTKFLSILRISCVFLCSLFFLLSSCKQSEHNLIPTSQSENDSTKKRELSPTFKEYWYDGTAEITSYRLSQERYGELHDGTAVMVFVTEDFLPEIAVKANQATESTISVLKMNQVKKFTTGIYPYSVMTSVFNPLVYSGHALKISHSMQEWCGHVYAQLNNRKDFEISSHSYFEGEADQAFSLPKTWLESELFNIIRIHPEELPSGEITIIPGFEYSRMSHKELSSQTATASMQQGDSISIFTLTYPDLKRELTIYFNSRFPYEIERWEEMHANGLKSTAEKLRRIRSSYWTQHSKQFTPLRDSLLLN